MREHLVTVDGRQLDVTEAGHGNGPAIFVHHGTPASKLLLPAWAADAEQRGARLISYSRPGYGASSRLEGRDVGQGAADVAAIADRLGVDRLATWGISGGGPHTLACAALLGERVVAAASLASVAPYGAEGLDWLEGMGEANVEEFGAAVAGKARLVPLIEGMAAAADGAALAEVIEEMRSILSPVDEAVLTNEVGAWLLDGLGAGVGGWVDDDLAFTRPWGFDVASISVPVQLWQGRQDLFVPFSHGEWLAAHIPGVEAHLMEDDGHLTLAVDRVSSVHAWLLDHF